MHRCRRLVLPAILLGSVLLGAPPARPLLWRANKGGKDGPTIHFLGSLHIGRADFYPVHKKVAAAYAAADTCVFEIDLVQAKMPWQIGRLLLRGRLGGGKTLQDVVSKKTWTDLQVCAQEVGMPMVMLRSMKPWMCAQLLTAAAVVKAGYNPENGTDLHFFRLALQDKRHIVPLETLGQQLDAIQKALEPLGETVLTETIKELADLDKSFGKLVRCWRQGDVEGLTELLKDMELGDEKAYQILLADRNKNWIPILEKTIVTPIPPPKATTEGAAKPVPAQPTGPRRLFVVVGAGHLVGKGSVVELLRKRGWTVVRE